MSRYFHLGILILAIAAVLFLIYKTPDVQPNAEFGGVSLRIDYATTAETRERGLSGRITIPSDYGMLFVFGLDDRYGFWMKDMRVPIDIFWLDSDRRVVSMALEVATSTYPNVFYPALPARYVLETAAGFGRSHGIATGTPLLLKSLQGVSK